MSPENQQEEIIWIPGGRRYGIALFGNGMEAVARACPAFRLSEERKWQ